MAYDSAVHQALIRGGVPIDLGAAIAGSRTATDAEKRSGLIYGGMPNWMAGRVVDGSASSDEQAAAYRYMGLSGSDAAILAAASIGSRQRGAWTLDQVIVTYDFASGSLPGSPFSTSLAAPFGDGTTPFAIAAATTTPATGRPSVTNVYQIHMGNYQSGHFRMLTLDLAAVGTAFPGHTPTKVRSYVCKTEGLNGSQVQAQMRKDTVNQRNIAAAANWAQYTDTITAAGTYDWRNQGTDINNSCAEDYYIANIEVLEANAPYLANDVVTYLGSTYRNSVDGNTNTPPGAGWTLIS